MTDTTRSVIAGVAFALGGLVVAGVAVAVVRARRAPQRGAEGLAEQEPGGVPAAGDDTGAPVASDIDHIGGVPADMRPADPSYGPVI